MPYTHRLLPDVRVALCRGWGIYDLSETLSILLALPDVDGFERDWGVILDVRQRAGAPVTADIDLLVRGLKPLDGRIGRIAIVARRPEQYGMARMAEIRASMHGHDIRAFMELRPALDWSRPDRPPTGLTSHSV